MSRISFLFLFYLLPGWPFTTFFLFTTHLYRRHKGTNLVAKIESSATCIFIFDFKYSFRFWLRILNGKIARLFNVQVGRNRQW